MNNFLEYFYGIKISKITYNDKYYSFIYNGYLYKLYIYDDENDIEMMYDINNKLVSNTLISEIINNRDNEIISHYNGLSYILIKIFVNPNKKIYLDEITSFSNFLYNYDEKIRSNWGILWSKKIDYLEELIKENEKKYPLIIDSFNYFVGMAENAIAYFNSILVDNKQQLVISHKKIRWNDNIESLYNPLNIILDYKVRDVAEYIKNSFFNQNYSIISELVEYLHYNHLSLIDIKLIISRLLYPSFYFDMYEDILIDSKDEKTLLNIITKIDEYENYLSDIIYFLKQKYDIYEIEWLKKRRH